METSAPLFLFYKIDMKLRSFLCLAALTMLIACDKTETSLETSSASEPTDTVQSVINSTVDGGTTSVSSQYSGEATQPDAQFATVTTAQTSKAGSAVAAAQDVDLTQPRSTSTNIAADENVSVPQAPNESAVVINLGALTDTTIQPAPETSSSSAQQPQTPTQHDSTTADPAAQPTPFIRRYPFTPEEEQYRLWYGWNSIDAFRAAKAREADGR